MRRWSAISCTKRTNRAQWQLSAFGAERTSQDWPQPRDLLRDFIARQLRDSRRLRLDGHLAVSFRNIARTVTLNGIQDAVLNASLNANGREAMLPRTGEIFP